MYAVLQMRWLWMGLLLLGLVQPALAESLKGGGNIWAPWMMRGPDEKPSGICVDIFLEAARQAGFEAEVSLYPQKRRDLLFKKNRIDLEIGVCPAWRVYQADISVYTDPFFETENVVLVRKENAIKAQSAADFHGKTLGANLGYYYTDGFQSAFEDGKIQRYDVKEGPALIRILRADRVFGVIMDRQEARYWIKTLNLDPTDFALAYGFDTKTRLAFRFHVNKKAVIPKFNQAIAAMKGDGRIARIAEQYTQ